MGFGPFKKKPQPPAEPQSEDKQGSGRSARPSRKVIAVGGKPAVKPVPAAAQSPGPRPAPKTAPVAKKSGGELLLADSKPRESSPISASAPPEFTGSLKSATRRGHAARAMAPCSSSSSARPS